jgi:type IV pilus assembly protein PilX
MVFALIALVLLLVGMAAMLRATDTSSDLAGNLAFRRDLTNRAETAIVAARAAFVSGALAADAARTANLGTANYSAVKLATGAGGVPLVLTRDSAFTSAGMKAPDIKADEVEARYVIDRQCTAVGEFSTTNCEAITGEIPPGGSEWMPRPGGIARPIYRISVRVKGPRGTAAYFQTTYVD